MFLSFKNKEILLKHLGSRIAIDIIEIMLRWQKTKKDEEFFCKSFKKSERSSGRTWGEDLNISRPTFNKYFDLFGIRYQSKTSYLKVIKEGKCPLQGKWAISYYDRINHVFSYRLDTEALQDFIKNPYQLIASPPPCSSEKETRSSPVSGAVGVPSGDPDELRELNKFKNIIN